jgi:hypothetical protein
MKNKRIVIILASLQLLFFGWIIFQSESHLAAGRIHKFQLRISDPSDPFRGRYMVLNFAEENLKISGFVPAENGKFHIQLGKDAHGFSIPINASNVLPADNNDWLEVSSSNFNIADSGIIYFNYPWDRYFLNEDAADAAEAFLIKHLRDSTSKCWAEVSIHRGKSILKDVKVNGISINDAEKYKK